MLVVRKLSVSKSSWPS